MRPTAKFTQAEVERVLKAIAKSGAKVSASFLPDGTVKLEPVVGDNTDSPSSEVKSDIIL